MDSNQVSTSLWYTQRNGVRLVDHNLGIKAPQSIQRQLNYNPNTTLQIDRSARGHTPRSNLIHHDAYPVKIDPNHKIHEPFLFDALDLREESDRGRFQFLLNGFQTDQSDHHLDFQRTSTFNTTFDSSIPYVGIKFEIQRIARNRREAEWWSTAESLANYFPRYDPGF